MDGAETKAGYGIYPQIGALVFPSVEVRLSLGTVGDGDSMPKGMYDLGVLLHFPIAGAVAGNLAVIGGARTDWFGNGSPLHPFVGAEFGLRHPIGGAFYFLATGRYEHMTGRDANVAIGLLGIGIHVPKARQ